MSKVVKTIDGHQGELLYIKGNTAFIKKSNSEVWYCPLTDIIDDISEYDKDKQIDTLHAQLEQEKREKEYFESEWKSAQIDIDHYKGEISNLKDEIKKQKLIWQELREFIIFDVNYDVVVRTMLQECVNDVLGEILDKMRELEQGEKDEQ